jgi:lipopolysaccharide assembly outer membrane protein LptD (OstA)
MGGISNPWHLVYANANWELNEYNRLVFNTSYNPNTSQFGLVNLTFRYQPDTERNIKLDVVYDPVSDVWSTLDLEARFRQKITRNLAANFDLLYSFFGDGVERARIGLGYDWHCRQIYFGYNVIDREYYLQIWYKAFSEAGFAFGSGQAGFAWPGSG